MEPVEVLVKFTVNGAVPEVALALIPATGGAIGVDLVDRLPPSKAPHQIPVPEANTPNRPAVSLLSVAVTIVVPFSLPVSVVPTTSNSQTSPTFGVPG